MSWNDFNTAEDQQSFEVIPRGTLAKVIMTIKPGGYEGPVHEWHGFATESQATGSIYLNCEFVVTEGEYTNRKFWSLIGLHSEKGPNWSNMGRTTIKGILNSANRLLPDDVSPAAQNARRLQTIGDLDGIEFVAKIGVDKDQGDDLKNVLKGAITPDHKDYALVMSGQAGITDHPVQATVAPAQSPSSVKPSSTTMQTGRPSWAQ